MKADGVTKSNNATKKCQPQKDHGGHAYIIAQKAECAINRTFFGEKELNSRFGHNRRQKEINIDKFEHSLSFFDSFSRSILAILIRRRQFYPLTASYLGRGEEELVCVYFGCLRSLGEGSGRWGPEKSAGKALC